MMNNMKLFIRFIVAFVVPWYFLGNANGKYTGKGGIGYTILLFSLFYSAILLSILELVVPNLGYVGLTIYLAFVAFCSKIRLNVRQRYNINGNLVEDFCASLFMYPCVAVQLYEHLNDRNDTKCSRLKTTNFKNAVWPTNGSTSVFVIRPIPGGGGCPGPHPWGWG